MKYYESYQRARTACNGYVQFASSYETDTGRELGRGKRRRRIVRQLSSDSDVDNPPPKKSSHKIPAPPPPPPPSGVSKSKLNVNGKKISKEKAVAKVQTREQLLDKIKTARKKAAETAQQKKVAMSAAFQNSGLNNLPSKTLQINAQHFMKQHKSMNSMSGPASQSPMIQSGSEGVHLRSPSNFFNSMSPINPLRRDKIKSPSPLKSHSQELRDGNKRSSVMDTSQSSPSSVVFSTSPKKTPNKAMSFVVGEREDRSSRDTDPVVRTPPPPPSSHVGTPSQLRRFSPIISTSKKSSSHVRSLFSSITPSKDGNDEKYLRLERKLDEVSSKLDILMMNVAKIHRSVSPDEAKLSRPPNLPPLPIENQEKLQEFEKFLKDDSNLSATCFYLQSFALPNDESKAVSKIMKRLITNNLATEYSFDGLGAKHPFKLLKLWEVVQGALLLKFPTSDLSAGTASLRSWLRNAKGRK